MKIRWSLLVGLLLLCGPWSAPSTGSENVAVHGDPAVQPDGVVRFVVQGEFRPTMDSARESALLVAQERMREWLAGQNPPIRRVPGLETIRREMVHREEPPQKEQILSSKDSMYKVTLEVDLQPKHIRVLRERERVITGLWTLGGLLIILGMVVMLCRIEEWTKGYLTRWLIAAGIGACLILFVAWWLVR